MITACTTRRRTQPGRIHTDLNEAKLQAASTTVPQRYRPPTAFVLHGKEGDLLNIDHDGYVRRGRVWDSASKQWVWLRCAAFDPATTTLPTPAASGLPFAA